MIDEFDDTTAPGQASSPTAHLMAELQLFGWQSFDAETDRRPIPDDAMLAGAVADIVDALASTCTDTILEPDLAELLWAMVNAFHRATTRIEQQLDRNEQDQRRLQGEQDGSEVKSVELERLVAQGEILVERRDAIEMMRDQAAERYERCIGSPWRPRAGSMVNRKMLTSSILDSRDFLAARKRADTKVMLPAGPKVALTGGLDFNDHQLVWDTLDRVHTKHPDMVLLHGGSPRGTEFIASRWADHRKVPQIAFKPDWTAHGKAAPFRRNDALLDVLPIGVLHFPGSGIQDNLRDKARKIGIPVWSFGGA
jgi:hypothetical protein